MFRDWGIPSRIALAGTAVWLLAKVLKGLASRGRPGTFFSDIHLRPVWAGLGFPSGHAAVAFAIAITLGPTLGRRWRALVWGIAIVAGMLRIYTAAHLPLDVIGGWGLGIAVGSAVELGTHSVPSRRSHSEGPVLQVD